MIAAHVLELIVILDARASLRPGASRLGDDRLLSEVCRDVICDLAGIARPTSMIEAPPLRYYAEHVGTAESVEDGLEAYLADLAGAL